MISKVYATLVMVFFLSFATSDLSFAQTQIARGILQIGGGQETGSDVCMTTDGGCAIAGYTFSYSPNANRCDVYVVKLDANGGLEWTRRVGGSDFDFGKSIRQTFDGGFIICGRSVSFSGNFHLYLVKLAADGTLEWDRAIGPSSGYGITWGNSVCQSSDSTYVFTGYAGSSVYVGKIDPQGNLVWQKTIGSGSGSGGSVGESIVQTAEGDYVIAGHTTSYGAGGQDVYVVKLSESGNLIWTKTIGTAIDDYGLSIANTTDSGFIIGGYSQENSNTNQAGPALAYFLRLDKSGNLLWDKTYQGETDDYVYSVQQTSDQGYIAGGFGGNYSSAAPMATLFALKLSPSGTVDWMHSVDSQDWINSNDLKVAMVRNSNGGYTGVGAGHYMVNNEIYQGVRLVKFDSLGNSCNSRSTSATYIKPVTFVVSDSGIINNSAQSVASGGISGTGGSLTVACKEEMPPSSISKDPQKVSGLFIYPNPSTSKLYVTNQGLQWYKPVRLLIYDVLGRVILRKELPANMTFPVMLNIESLRPGTYLIKALDSGSGIPMMQQKFLKITE